MDDFNPRWRELYQAALLELDRDKLLQYIELAEQAIHVHAGAQLQPVSQNQHERQAMEDALRALNLLRRSVLRE